MFKKRTYLAFLLLFAIGFVAMPRHLVHHCEHKAEAHHEGHHESIDQASCEICDFQFPAFNQGAELAIPADISFPEFQVSTLQTVPVVGFQSCILDRGPPRA